MAVCIRLDFESLADAAAALSQPQVMALPVLGALGRPALESALTSVRAEWSTDAVSNDGAELGARLSASAQDFRATEETAVRTLRELESVFL